jgi:Holliday junction resolvase RusA-like endonuclease
MTIPAGIEQPILDLCAPATTPGPGAAEDGRGGYGAPAAAGPPQLVVVVYGKPAPQGSKKAFVNRYTGRAQVTEDNPRTKTWRGSVQHHAEAAMAGCSWVRVEPPCGVVVRIVCAFDKPASAPKRRAILPVTRATYDVDKLARAVLDALTAAGVFKDDSQVVRLSVEKEWLMPGEPAPGARIVVRQVTP